MTYNKFMFLPRHVAAVTNAAQYATMIRLKVGLLGNDRLDHLHPGLLLGLALVDDGLLSSPLRTVALLFRDTLCVSDILFISNTQSTCQYKLITTTKQQFVAKKV